MIIFKLARIGSLRHENENEKFYLKIEEEEEEEVIDLLVRLFFPKPENKVWQVVRWKVEHKERQPRKSTFDPD